MPEISIILPSLRRKFVLQRIKEFSITNKSTDYEIVVVSPFDVKENKVIHVREEKPSGYVFAVNLGYKSSSGKYIVFWADDLIPTTNCLSNMLRFIKGKKECPFIGSFRIKYKETGQECEPYSVYGKLYACFGCVLRTHLDIIGGFFDPVFKQFWADPDMSLRTWENGGKVEICPDAWGEKVYCEDERKKSNWSKYVDKDTKTFFDRWHTKLGKGVKREFNTVNRPIPFSRRHYLLSIWHNPLNVQVWRHSIFYLFPSLRHHPALSKLHRLLIGLHKSLIGSNNREFETKGGQGK